MSTLAHKQQIPLILFGAGGHARALIDVVQAQGSYTLLGLVDSISKPGERVAGFPVLGSEADLPALLQRHACNHVFVALGDNFQRHAASRRLLVALPALRFATLVHPGAIVSPSARLGAGVVVMPGAIINAGSVVEEGVLVNTRASIDHDCHLASFSSVAPGVVCGGKVLLGERSAVNIGASVANRISIGTDTVIGAGAVVLKDMPAGVLAFGVPCRVVRQRRCDEKYL